MGLEKSEHFIISAELSVANNLKSTVCLKLLEDTSTLSLRRLTLWRGKTLQTKLQIPYTK